MDGYCIVGLFMSEVKQSIINKTENKLIIILISGKNTFLTGHVVLECWLVQQGGLRSRRPH